ncbi:hypothetical protein ACLK2D_12655 [Escherichia coli]
MARGEKPRYDGRCRHSHEHHADDEPLSNVLLTRRKVLSFSTIRSVVRSNSATGAG